MCGYKVHSQKTGKEQRKRKRNVFIIGKPAMNKERGRRDRFMTGKPVMNEGDQ